MSSPPPASPAWPLEIIVHQRQRRLEIAFDDGNRFDLPASLLRAMTPSAAERGHGSRSDGPLAVDFSGVSLRDARVVGAYAVRLVFDDGHDSGIYTWDALYRLGVEKASLLAAYALATSQGTEAPAV